MDSESTQPHREKLQQLLEMAERHIAEGEARIARLRQRVCVLEQDGCDLSAARAAVKQYEELQKLHLADRDSLIQLLMPEAGSSADHPLVPAMAASPKGAQHLRAVSEEVDRIVAELASSRGK